MSNGEVKFDIGDKAKQLMFKVFDSTTDKAHYPSKFRCLAGKLQEYVLNIHSNVLDANSFRSDSPEHKSKRFDLQTEAITNVNKFLDLTDYSFSRNRISAATCEEWTGLAHDIKFMTLAWRKS
jgi:hypothetical protein